MTTDVSTLVCKTKNFYDLQRVRMAMGNRVPKPNAKINLTPNDLEMFGVLTKKMSELEDLSKKMLDAAVRAHPMWDGFFKDLKGCAEAMASVILSEIDINRATTISKMWAVSGLGKERQWDVTYRERKRSWPTDKTPDPKWGKWSSEKTVQVWGTSEGSAKNVIPKKREKEVVREFSSVTLVDGTFHKQRRREGQYPSYKNWLKTKLLGVLASCLIRSPTKSIYVNRYYEYKARLKQQQAAGEDLPEEEKRWRSDGHVDLAAKRFMIKELLKDVYTTWRALEGLPVRPPYSEEYLDLEHHEDESA